VLTLHADVSTLDIPEELKDLLQTKKHLLGKPSLMSARHLFNIANIFSRGSNQMLGMDRKATWKIP